MSSYGLISIAVGFALGAAVVPLTVPRAQDVPAGMAEEMKKMIEQAGKYVQPGELHKKLADYVGKWDCVTTMTMGPGAAAPVGKSTAEISWLMEGRWLKQETRGTFMNMPYHAFGLLGHDNFKQSFVSSWIDNQNTFKLDSEGRLLQDGKTLILYGTMDEYLNGENDKMVKYVYRWKDADHFNFEVHDLAIGESNTKVVEVAYSRAR